MKFESSASRPGPLWVMSVAMLAALGVGACSSSSGTNAGAATKGDAGGTGGAGGAGGGAGAARATWTMIGYDERSNFFNPAETKLSTSNVANLTELWPAHLFSGQLGGTATGASGTPCVVGDTVYVVGSSAVYAIDAKTGDELWKKEGTDVLLGASGSPACEDGKLYMLNGSGGEVYALDLTDSGNVLWHTSIDSSDVAAGWSSVIIAGDTLVVGTSSGSELSPPATPYRGAVVALNKADGAVKWTSYTASATEDGCSVWAAPSVDIENKLVFAPAGNNYSMGGEGSDSIHAFDLETGALKWHFQATKNDVFTIANSRGNPDSDFGGNPVVYDYKGKKLLAAGQKSGVVFIFDRLTGDVLAQRDMGGKTSMPGGFFQALAFDGERLVGVCNKATSTEPGSEPGNGLSAGNATSVLVSLDPATLDINWERQLPAYVWGPLTIANGVGYVGIETTLQAFDVKDGTKLYELKVGGTITGAPTISEGRLFFPSGMSFFGSGHPDTHFHGLGLP